MWYVLYSWNWSCWSEKWWGLEWWVVTEKKEIQIEGWKQWMKRTWFMATSSSISWLALVCCECAAAAAAATAAAGDGKLRWLFSFGCCCCDSSLGLVGAVCWGGSCCWCWLLLVLFVCQAKRAEKNKRNIQLEKEFLLTITHWFSILAIQIWYFRDKVNKCQRTQKNKWFGTC